VFSKRVAHILPLDPAYPGERLAFMLEDAGAPLLLTQQHLAKLLPAGEWQVLDVDEVGTSNQPVVPIENPVSGSDLSL